MRAASRAFLVAVPALLGAVMTGSMVLVGETGGPASAAEVSHAAPCRAGEVSAAVTEQPQLAEGSTRRALLVLTNLTATTCAADGWARIGLLDDHGAAVPVSTVEVPRPGPARRFDLEPGASAYAGLRWTACDGALLECAEGTSLDYRMTGTSPAAPATMSGFPASFTMATLKVGSLQPTDEGVLF